MKVLVPGGCGYVGAYLVPLLLGDGHHVTVVDPQWFGNGYMPDNPRLKVVRGAVHGDRRVDRFREHCEGMDAMILLSSMSSDAMCQKYPERATFTNVKEAAWAVADARACGIGRIIYASSVAAYGSMERDAVEKDKLNPTTLYGKGKRDAEEAIKAEFAAATIVRSASVCGYSPRMRFDLTVNKMVHDAVRHGTITVNGGEQRRSHVHMKDICDFYRTLLKKHRSKVCGETYNVVAENQSVRDTAETVRDFTACGIRYAERTDDRSYTVSGAKALVQLGWKPKHTVADAVRDIKLKFDCGQWKDSVSNPLYQNVAELA